MAVGGPCRNTLQLPCHNRAASETKGERIATDIRCNYLPIHEGKGAIIRGPDVELAEFAKIEVEDVTQQRNPRQASGLIRKAIGTEDQIAVRRHPHVKHVLCEPGTRDRILRSTGVHLLSWHAATTR